MKTSTLTKKAAAAIFLMLLLLHSIGSTIFAAEMHCDSKPGNVCLSDGGSIPDPKKP